jgi:putative AbiEii toxin of type IV toxin-antitoxin system
MAGRNREINLPAPCLKRLWIDPGRVPDREAYPFCLPFLRDDFEIRFERAITIDEPESALSPSRQIEFLKLMRRMDEIGHCQIIMATHAPMLMYPDAKLLRLTNHGLEPTTVEQTDHYKTLREFFDDPSGFVEAAIHE